MTKFRRISKGFVLDLAEKRRKEKNNCMHRCDGHPDSTNNIFTVEFDSFHRTMLERLWTSSGRGDRREVTWWGPLSISIMESGSAEVMQFTLVLHSWTAVNELL